MNKNNRNNAFKTPKGYFEEFSNDLNAKIALEDSVLSNSDKNNSFKIPEGYFETVNQKISRKLDVRKSKIISLNPYRKYYYSAVAVAAVLLLIFNIQGKTTEVSYTFNDLTRVDIETYFNLNEFEHTDYELAEAIPATNVQMANILDNTYDQENVMEYLENTIDDIEELNIEF